MCSFATLTMLFILSCSDIRRPPTCLAKNMARNPLRKAELCSSLATARRLWRRVRSLRTPQAPLDQPRFTSITQVERPCRSNNTISARLLSRPLPSTISTNGTSIRRLPPSFLPLCNFAAISPTKNPSTPLSLSQNSFDHCSYLLWALAIPLCIPLIICSRFMCKTPRLPSILVTAPPRRLPRSRSAGPRRRSRRHGPPSPPARAAGSSGAAPRSSSPSTRWARRRRRRTGNRC